MKSHKILISKSRHHNGRSRQTSVHPADTHACAQHLHLPSARATLAKETFLRVARYSARVLLIALRSVFRFFLGEQFDPSAVAQGGRRNVLSRSVPQPYADRLELSWDPMVTDGTFPRNAKVLPVTRHSLQLEHPAVHLDTYPRPAHRLPSDPHSQVRFVPTVETGTPAPHFSAHTPSETSPSERRALAVILSSRVHCAKPGHNTHQVFPLPPSRQPHKPYARLPALRASS